MSRRAAPTSPRRACGRAWRARSPPTCCRPAGCTATPCRETPTARRTARSCSGGSSRPRPSRARVRRASHRARCSLKARGRMSDRRVTLERLGALFLQHFHVEVPSPDTDLLETGMLDSLQLVDLLLLIEEEFGQRISLQAIELDDLRTLARLAELVGTSAGATPDARAVSTSSDVRPPQPEPVRGAAIRGRRVLNHRGQEPDVHAAGSARERPAVRTDL